MTIVGTAVPKFLIDINVILDVVLRRGEWYKDAASLLNHIVNGRAEGYVAAHTISTMYFLARKSNGKKAADEAVADIMKIVHVVPLDNNDVQHAVILDFNDFEDALQAAAALRIGADWIVTRNGKHFKKVSIGAIDATEALARI